MSAGAIEGVGRGGGLGGSPAARAAGREDQRPGAVALVDLGVRVEPIDGIIIRAREVDAGSRHAQEARAVRPRTARELLGASGERCPAGVVDERVLGGRREGDECQHQKGHLRRRAPGLGRAPAPRPPPPIKRLPQGRSSRVSARQAPAAAGGWGGASGLATVRRARAESLGGGLQRARKRVLHAHRGFCRTKRSTPADSTGHAHPLHSVAKCVGGGT